MGPSDAMNCWEDRSGTHCRWQVILHRRTRPSLQKLYCRVPAQLPSLLGILQDWLVSRLARGKALCQVVENKSDLPVLTLHYQQLCWGCCENPGTPGGTEQLFGWAWGCAGTDSCCSLASLPVGPIQTSGCLQFSTVPQGSWINMADCQLSNHLRTRKSLNIWHHCLGQPNCWTSLGKGSKCTCSTLRHISVGENKISLVQTSIF